MSKFEIPKTYDFKETEPRIYQFWEENGYFKPTNDPHSPDHDPTIEPYVISIPPPNVTGKLHLGHPLFVSLEDLMIRYHRMKGVPTLWVPGTDHAGIATQLQVELALRQEGTSRLEIGREAFLEKAWAWKAEFGGIITHQIRRIGASCDWDRERFTMDDGLSRAVREAFVRLYDKGLIYRGPRLINWSPGLQTAVSDLEVEYSQEPGTLYYFKYLVDGSDEFIPVATTRPETILGDTAVAVHPDDERFNHLVGKKAIVPVLGRKIPIISDEYVDREFGTGALKITPGHDPNDFEIGERHNLEVISVLDKEARINEHGGKYHGQDRFEARQNLWDDMKKAGLVIKEEPYTLNVPRSQRGGEIIEPLVSTQWFVDIQPLASRALQAVEDGRITIIPERFKKVYRNWMENIRDWCISRQLWWGHRIPVWYCDDCGELTVPREDPDRCSHCQSENIHQDPDVLDTWFSSGLWPFSTLGWPEHTKDYEYFYPTTMMETGYDILFFWVARMIMMGLEFTDQVPFRHVYLHGLIRDEHGKKMSKSYGNVIDPLDVMDQFGTDALRFTLLVGSTPGLDTNISVSRVEANRNFANKLWNAARLILGIISDAPKTAKSSPDWSLADRWILARTQQTIISTTRLFENHQYGEAGRQLYDFFWTEFADWYLEIAKLQARRDDDSNYYTSQVLVQVFDTTLRLLHPFVPFVTEELWGILKNAASSISDEFAPTGGWEEALIIAKWPQAEEILVTDETAIQDFEHIMEVIRSIRNLRAENKIKPNIRVPAILVSGSGSQILEQERETIIELARLDESMTEIEESLENTPQDFIPSVVGTTEIYISVKESIDVEEEIERLGKSLAEAQSQIDRLEKLLASPFAEKAPPEIVEKERQKLEEYYESADKIESQLKDLKK